MEMLWKFFKFESSCFLYCSLYLTVFATIEFVCCDRCCDINSEAAPLYRLIRSNGRSNQPIVSRKRVYTLDKCKEFAASKKALAFNFGRDKNFSGKSCQALQCPELHNFTSLVRDRNYKYYSMYPPAIALGAGTLACVPNAGIFLLSGSHLNFSQAQRSCRKANGSLAHVISEERTNGLARYIPRDTLTFVGLSNRDSERIWKNEFDEPLTCFEYRAWGHREPSHFRGCVSLVHPTGNDAAPFWRVVPCGSVLPFICEISPLLRPEARPKNRRTSITNSTNAHPGIHPSGRRQYIE